jgi:uncharacterized protein (TIGR01777 family)
VGTTRFLAEALAALKRPPRSFLVVSAVGFYGNRGDEELNEGSPPGSGFLAENCAAWEAAAEPARQAGIRTLHVRTGVVVTLKGGAIPRMLPPFLAGVGGRIGNGRQWMSWIALEDLVGLVHHLVRDESLSGPVNAVSPEPVTNREFTRVLGKVLRRPVLFPLPALAVQAVFGEMGKALLLEGQRVLPRKLEASGFKFLHAGLESALRWELGR